MKNKKLVATVASLCLVVVAVVAAVVGVFAATQQKLGATVSVSYTAVNVSATVDLKTYGLKNRTSGSDTTHVFGSDTYAQTIFNPTANSNANGAVTGAPVATAEIAQYEYGWEDTSTQLDKFIGFSVYGFMFTNYNESKALNLSWTVTGTNLSEFCYTSTAELTIGKANFTGSWTDISGDLSATATSFTAKTSGNDAPTNVQISNESYSATVSTSGTIYVYVVLALSDANTAAGSAQIDFTLASAS